MKHILHRFWQHRAIVWQTQSHGHQTILEVRQPLAVALPFVMLVWYILTPADETIVWLVGSAGLLAAAWFWAYQMVRRVYATRQLQHSAIQLGDELEELITLHNTSFLPVLWAEFVDHTNLPGHTLSSVRAAPAYHETRWRAHTICKQRGIFTLGPWELKLGDLFGIFLIRHVYAQPQEILVYPPQAELPQSLLPHSGSMGEHRLLHQPLASETINALQTRPYQSGDPLRRLHWRTTARRQSPYVKIFEPEAASTIWLVADLDASVHCGAGEQSTLETEILILASLAAHLLRQGLCVGLFAGARPAEIVPPRSGNAHLWAILCALAPLQPQASQPLAQTMQTLRPLLGGRDLPIIVTPSLALDWPASVYHASQNTHGNIAEAILLDPLSFGGTESAESIRPILAGMGISAQVIRRGDIRPLQGIYGEISRWEFATLGTGRVFVRHAPRLHSRPA